MKLPILLFANFISSIAMGIALTIVPWELANTTGGSTVLALTATWATAILIFVSPIAGRIVDSMSRRSVLMISVIVLGVALQLVSFAYDNDTLRIVSLSAFYFLSQMYFLFFDNALTTFVQEIFHKRDRGKVNGWLQVEMQASTFIVGFLIIYLVTGQDFKYVLLINGLLMLLSALTLTFIPYVRKTRPVSLKVAKDVYLTIAKRTDLLLLGLCDGALFVCVMMLNIIEPIYFNSVLKVDISAVAMVSIAWGVGAGLSGFLVGRIVTEDSALTVLKIGVLTYAGALLVICLNPALSTIVTMMFVCGAMGSGTRVAFRTFVMSKVHNDIFGSYMAVVQTMTYVQRTAFGLALAFIIASFPASNYFWFVLAICCFAFLMLMSYTAFASDRILIVTRNK